jgi:hypothetical protein
MKRQLTAEELERWKQFVSVTPHNYEAWAGTTSDFDLWTDELLVYVCEHRESDIDPDRNWLYIDLWPEPSIL